MSQIALVSDQHDDDVGIGVVTQLLQPPVDILVGLMFADVVHEQGADRTSVVSGRDGPVPFLTSSIPDLSLDCLGIHLDGPGSELDSDGGLGVQVELVPGETTQQVGFTNAGVTNQHHYPFELVSFFVQSPSTQRVVFWRGEKSCLHPPKVQVATLPLKRNYMIRISFDHHTKGEKTGKKNETKNHLHRIRR